MRQPVLQRSLLDVAVVGFALVAAAHSLWVEPVVLPGENPLWWWVDLVVIVVTTGLLLARRRAPVAVAVAVWALNVLSPLVWGAACVVTFGLAVRRPWPTAVGLGALSLVVGLLADGIRPRPEPEVGFWPGLAWVAVVVVALLASGMALRARHQLMDSLVERAERAESEAALRAEAARSGERTRIAREMHDVLAHRLSLVSMHAGALSHRANPSREEVADALEVIRSGASRALVDLRAILGVLRDPDTDARDAETAAHPPQPTLTDLGHLVDEVRAAGTPVRLHDGIGLTGGVVPPDESGRTLYRVAQETLTNAARHAPGRPVDVRLSGCPGTDVALDVSNPLPGDVPAHPHGAGTGLLGVTERITLAGGRVLARGPEGDRFRVAVTIPWRTEDDR